MTTEDSCFWAKNDGSSCLYIPCFDFIESRKHIFQLTYRTLFRRTLFGRYRALSININQAEYTRRAQSRRVLMSSFNVDAEGSKEVR